MKALQLQMPLHETLLRASAVFLALGALLRAVPKRKVGSIAPHDLIGAVIVGGLAVHGILGRNAGPLDILVMIAVVLTWNLLLDWIGDRVPVLRRFIREPPTCLVRNGMVLREALRREMLTEEELLAQLRKHGVDDVNIVREAHLEADGEVSVVKQ